MPGVHTRRIEKEPIGIALTLCRPLSTKSDKDVLFQAIAIEKLPT